MYELNMINLNLCYNDIVIVDKTGELRIRKKASDYSNRLKPPNIEK